MESTNKPVAWMDDFGNVFPLSYGKIKGTPLYTHPVKQLSDEEIEAILKKSMVIKGVWGQPMQELDPMVFARAIIKEITE